MTTQTLTPAEARALRTRSTLEASRRVLDFIAAHMLVSPTVEVTTPSPGEKPHATFGVFGDPSEFVAWLRAVGAQRVRVQARSCDTCAWADGEVGGVVYVLAGSMPHDHGTVHLPGSGVTWDSGRYGSLTVEAFERGLRNSGLLPTG